MNSSKIFIRPLCIEDAKTSFKWRNNKTIWEYTGSRPDKMITEDIEMAWLEKVLNETNSKRFAIVTTDDQKYIGNIQLTNIHDHEAEYHIFIGEETEWGKGYARIASEQLLKYAKDELKLQKVFLRVNPIHEKAINLYKSLGFIQLNNEIKMKITF